VAEIDGVQPIDGSFIEHLLGRDSEGFRGVTVEQDSENHSVSLKVEVKVRFGILIPEKSEEVQNAISKAISDYTGLHVSSVHVVFKNVYTAEPEEQPKEELED